MTLQIGNKGKAARYCKNQSAWGFSFFEVMVTTAILSFGLVLIYKAFFISLDYAGHVTRRLHAITLIDNTISELQKRYEEEHVIPFDKKLETKKIMINNKEVDFRLNTYLKPVLDLENIYQANVYLYWNEGKREVKLSRSTYVSDPRIGAETD